MAESESPITAGPEGKKPSDPLTQVAAGVLLYGVVSTGIVLSFAIASYSWSGFLFTADPGFIGSLLPVLPFIYAIPFLAFGLLEGLVNRGIGRAFWSVSKSSMLADMFIRGPTALGISWWLTMLVALPAVNRVIFVPSSGLAAIALLAILVTPWNGLVAVATVRWRFGRPYEVGTGTGTIFGICPNCKAAYHFSPSAIVGGLVRCQNCDKAFQLLAEGPSVD